MGKHRNDGNRSSSSHHIEAQQQQGINSERSYGLRPMAQLTASGETN